MKDTLTVTIFCILIVCMIGGFIWLLNWAYDNDLDRSKKECEQIAALAGTREFYADNNNCLILKNSKIIKVEK